MLLDWNLISSCDEVSAECEWKWPTILLLWVIINCTPMWIVIWTSKKYRPTAEHLANPKFRPFLRLDIHEWSYTLTVFTHFFFRPKFFIGWGCLMFTCISTFLISLFFRKDEQAGPIRMTVYSWLLWIACRIPLFLFGGVWISHKKVAVCYKKWLGPDWTLDRTKSFQGAGIYVANHQSFGDIFL